MITFSIIQQSHLEGAQRLDAEYYQPEYLETKRVLLTAPYLRLGDCAFVTDGEHGSVGFEDTGIKYLTAENISEGFLRLEDIRYVDELVDKRNKRASLVKEDVVLSIKGTVGLAALIFQENLPANMNRDVSRIHVNKLINPYFLTIFLNSKFGRRQTLRESSGNVQQMITLSRIRELLVPKVNQLAANKVGQLYLECYEKLNESKELYSKAENLLLEELGLKDFQPRDDLSFVVNLSDVQSAHRADAEFFQPSIRRLTEHIVSKGNALIKDIQIFNRRGVQPKYTDDGEVKVVTSKHLGPSSIDYDSLDKTTIDEWKNSTSARITQYDVLIYTTGANVGRTNCYLESDKALASNHVNILKVKDINPIYLTVFLNSVLGQKQIRRFVSGSAQVELYPNDIGKLVVWNAPKSTQSKIADLIQQSHTARKKSKELLEEAKRKVEAMIEKGNV